MARQEFVYQSACFSSSATARTSFPSTRHLESSSSSSFKLRRQNRKSHNLNKADVLFFDVMILCMRMVNTERAFVRRDVVAQCQIEFERIAHFSCDRRDRVVRLSVSLGEYKRILIRVTSPAVQDMLARSISRFSSLWRIRMTDSGHLTMPVSTSSYPLMVKWRSIGAFAIAKV